MRHANIQTSGTSKRHHGSLPAEAGIVCGYPSGPNPLRRPQPQVMRSRPYLSRWRWARSA